VDEMTGKADLGRSRRYSLSTPRQKACGKAPSYSDSSQHTEWSRTGTRTEHQVTAPSIKWTGVAGTEYADTRRLGVFFSMGLKT
jgi:hypothetical protein